MHIYSLSLGISRRDYEEVAANKEQQEEKRLTYIKKDIVPIGDGSLVCSSLYPYFIKNHILEIHDVWVSAHERGKGFSRKLLLYLESCARARGYVSVGLDVGLYQDYGKAQQLYFRLGYMSDGQGIIYKYRTIYPLEKYLIDDDLVLWLIKNL